MFTWFNRKRSAKKFAWRPDVNYSDSRVVATLMTFPTN